jgi:fructose-1,6-bisphosphatase/inositol monophosphatase family enzyme
MLIDMAFHSDDDRLRFIIDQIGYIGDVILAVNQSKAEVTIDKSKELPPNADPRIAQAHCTIDDVSQEYFLRKLIEEEPDAQIIAEEDTPTVKKFAPGQKKKIWYGDLLDGTHLYGIGSPNFGSSIGYADEQGMKAAAVYFPRLGTLLHAQKGKGAILNSERLTAQDTRSPTLEDTICLNSKITKETEKRLQKAGYRTTRPHCTVFGHLMVARGEATAYLAQYTTVWDVAPFSFILEEAGMVARRFDLSLPDYSKRGLVPDYIAAPNERYAAEVIEKAGLLTHS